MATTDGLLKGLTV